MHLPEHQPSNNRPAPLREGGGVGGSSSFHKWARQEMFTHIATSKSLCLSIPLWNDFYTDRLHRLYKHIVEKKGISLKLKCFPFSLLLHLHNLIFNCKNGLDAKKKCVCMRSCLPENCIIQKCFSSLLVYAPRIKCTWTWISFWDKLTKLICIQCDWTVHIPTSHYITIFLRSPEDDGVCLGWKLALGI